MRNLLFGSSGLRVSEYCLGAMTIGEEWGWGASLEESRKMADAFAAAGGNFIDTANYYTAGTSEKYVGEIVRADRDHWVVATKYTLSMGEGDPNKSGNHRKNLRQAVEASLKRLGMEAIDLLWLHVWDFTTPVDEVLRGLDDLVRQGKIHYAGISDTPAWIVSQANTMADLRGWTRFVGLQIEYSLRQRAPERDLLPMAREFDLAVAAWSPLGGGVLTGKFNGANAETGGRLANYGGPKAKDLPIAEVVLEVARELGRPASQVALAWLRQQRGQVIPIVGARRAEQLVENLGAVGLELSAEQMGRLNAVSAIELGFPHEFLQSPGIHKAMGNTLGLIDNHRGKAKHE